MAKFVCVAKKVGEVTGMQQYLITTEWLIFVQQEKAILRGLPL